MLAGLRKVGPGESVPAFSAPDDWPPRGLGPAVEWEPSADAPPPPASPDPILAAVDACPFREGCTCRLPFRCLLAGLPAYVTLADCRRCPVALGS